MKYLLDVNTLIAWWHHTHPKHAVFHSWEKKAGFASMATCATVELGFLRISMHVYRYRLAEAETALARLKQKAGSFIADAPSPKLPAWSDTGSKTTDAYLCQLAHAHGMRLATFDYGIKDAAVFLIS
jgi:predicted nucleic acid-binding protein